VYTENVIVRHDPFQDFIKITIMPTESGTVLISPESPIQDSSVAISDSVTLTQNNPNYEVDEEGNKRYVISVIDVPALED